MTQYRAGFLTEYNNPWNVKSMPYVFCDGKPWIPTVTLAGARKLAKRFNAGQAPMQPLFPEEEGGDAETR